MKMPEPSRAIANCNCNTCNRLKMNLPTTAEIPGVDDTLILSLMNVIPQGPVMKDGQFIKRKRKSRTS